MQDLPAWDALKLELHPEDRAALEACPRGVLTPYVIVEDGRIVRATVAVNEGPVPEELSRLPVLRELVIRRNTLHGGASSLPDLSGFAELETLRIDGNPLKTLPESLGLLRRLKILDASDCRLAKLPAGLFSLPELHTLNLSENPLATLPDSLGRLRALRTLDLSRCRIRGLPKTVGDLAALKSLRAHGLFESVPEEIGGLRALRVLDLGQRVRRLPESLGNLEALEDLRVGCDVRSLPLSVGGLKRLKKLKLEGPFFSLPEGLGATPVEVVDLDGGRLEGLPELKSVRDLRVPPAVIPRLKGRMADLARARHEKDEKEAEEMRSLWEDR